MSSVFIIMIIAGILGGILASFKGRSAAGWGIFCFLIPVLILIVLVLPSLKVIVMPSSKRGEAQAGKSSIYTKPPPNPNRERTIYDNPADFPEPSRKCPFCAEEIRLEAIYCKHCKKDLPPTEKVVTKE